MASKNVYINDQLNAGLKRLSTASTVGEFNKLKAELTATANEARRTQLELIAAARATAVQKL